MNSVNSEKIDGDNGAMIDTNDMNNMQELIVGSMILLFVVVVVVMVYLILQFSRIIKSFTRSTVSASTPLESHDELNDDIAIQEKVKERGRQVCVE